MDKVYLKVLKDLVESESATAPEVSADWYAGVITGIIDLLADAKEVNGEDIAVGIYTFLAYAFGSSQSDDE